MGDLPTASIRTFYPSPRFTTTLRIKAEDYEGNKPGIAETVLLEDGVPIKTIDNLFMGYGAVDLTRKPGTHRYALQVTDNDGNTIWTEGLEINFTGFTKENTPEATIKASLPVCRKTTEIVVDKKDGLDNKGLEWIKVYQDGNLLKTDQYFSLTKTVKVTNTPGKHTYYAELKYVDGPIIKSPEITVEYRGIDDTLLPTAIISSEIKEPGQSTQLKVEWKDNYDNQCVKRVNIFEDDALVSILEDQVSFSKLNVDPKTPGMHRYHAEVEYRGGHTITTDPIEVNFSGEIVDLDPTIHILYFDGKMDVIAGDSGDNKGLAKIVLYKDNREIPAEINLARGHLSSNVTDLEGKTHEYYAEATDLAGQVVRSKVIKVESRTTSQ